MKKVLSLFLLLYGGIVYGLVVSAGGYEVTKSKDGYSFKDASKHGKLVNITDVLRKKSHNTSAVTLWITKDWQEGWYCVEQTQKEVIDKGYTPIFIFYYFADAISPSYVKKYEKDYFTHLERFSRYLQRLDGQKIVVLNPEYNMAGVGKLEMMNDIFLKSYKILRKDPQVVVGPCVGDFGDYAKVNEPKEWVLFHPSLQYAARKADFIAFQEMRALTRNNYFEILQTPQRAYNMAKYLYKKYKKPTLLAYAAISSYGKGGEQVQARVYKGFVKYLPKMQKEAKLFGFGTFHYFDYPKHQGYFKNAEEHFGILKKDGTAKEAFYYYNKLH